MERLVDKILSCLFISMLMMPVVLSRRLAVENMADNNSRIPDTKNSTEEDHNHDAAGIRRAVQGAPNVYFGPNHNCFLQYFINGQPPIGLRTANLQNMRYICQERPNVNQPGTYYYATMFDEGLGIAVYSAYVLHGGNVHFQSQGGSPTWIQTPGIQRQGSNAAYAGQPCHKGHLYAALTASGNPQTAANSHRSTYQYTNAVPQCGSFNTGQWRVWEGNIRAYAVQTCTAMGGVLYLLTGVAFVAIQNTNPPQPIAVQITALPGGIYKPSSMWTAGTCVYPNAPAESFAVIGNNVPNPPGMLTQATTLAQLEVILGYDIQTNGLKRDRSSRVRGVKLFPAVRKSKPIKLPRDEYPPKHGKGPKPPKPPGPSYRPDSKHSSKKQSSKHQSSKHQSSKHQSSKHQSSKHQSSKHQSSKHKSSKSSRTG